MAKAKRAVTDMSRVVAGDLVLFGEYPQTLKASGVEITDERDGRGYYLGSDGAYYAAVAATPRTLPEIHANPVFSGGQIPEADSVYYFKVEPIRWRVAHTGAGRALLVCESILDARRFDVESNRFGESEICAWLNGAFYENAFTEAQKNAILTVTLPCEKGAGRRFTAAANADVVARVYLPSVDEVTDAAYGFSESGTERAKRPCDHALAKGAVLDGECGWWWLRTPSRFGAPLVRHVVCRDVGSSFGCHIHETLGIVPALQIAL